MEKEKKGLFGRLLDFLKGKSETEMADGIGFWNDGEIVEKHFAEMGAVASLTQEEVKKTFWQKETKEEPEKQKRIFEMAEDDQQNGKTPAKEQETEKESKIGFSAVFKEDLQGKMLERTFPAEMPEGRKERRRVLPVTDEAEDRVEFFAEEERRDTVRESIRKEEMPAEPVVDVEKLMRQMTKMLWEERESCGRRLR